MHASEVSPRFYRVENRKYFPTIFPRRNDHTASSVQTVSNSNQLPRLTNHLHLSEISSESTFQTVYPKNRLEQQNSVPHVQTPIFRLGSLFAQPHYFGNTQCIYIYTFFFLLFPVFSGQAPKKFPPPRNEHSLPPSLPLARARACGSPVSHHRTPRSTVRFVHGLSGERRQN